MLLLGKNEKVSKILQTRRARDIIVLLIPRRVDKNQGRVTSLQLSLLPVLNTRHLNKQTVVNRVPLSHQAQVI